MLRQSSDFIPFISIKSILIFYFYSFLPIETLSEKDTHTQIDDTA